MKRATLTPIGERWLVARGGPVDTWSVTIGPTEYVDEAERRMKAARGVLWKWDSITQLAVVTTKPRNAVSLDD